MLFHSFDSKIIRFTGNPDARVLLSNMCMSVTAQSLRILFSDFNVKTLTINHDKNGKSVGTGIVVLPKKDAIRLIRQFTDVFIGSSNIQFKLIAAFNIEKRVRFADKQDENEPAKRILTKQHEKTRGFLKKMNTNNLNPNILVSTFTNLSI